MIDDREGRFGKEELVHPSRRETEQGLVTRSAGDFVWKLDGNQP